MIPLIVAVLVGGVLVYIMLELNGLYSRVAQLMCEVARIETKIAIKSIKEHKKPVDKE